MRTRAYPRTPGPIYTRAYPRTPAPVACLSMPDVSVTARSSRSSDCSPHPQLGDSRLRFLKDPLLIVKLTNEKRHVFRQPLLRINSALQAVEQRVQVGRLNGHRSNDALRHDDCRLHERLLNRSRRRRLSPAPYRRMSSGLDLLRSARCTRWRSRHSRRWWCPYWLP